MHCSILARSGCVLGLWVRMVGLIFYALRCPNVERAIRSRRVGFVGFPCGSFEIPAKTRGVAKGHFVRFEIPCRFRVLILSRWVFWPRTRLCMGIWIYVIRGGGQAELAWYFHVQQQGLHICSNTSAPPTWYSPRPDRISERHSCAWSFDV